MMKDENLRKYIENTFGCAEEARSMILLDLFRHGFDGSGGK